MLLRPVCDCPVWPPCGCGAKSAESRSVMTQEVALELELVVPSPVDAATSVRATLTCVICGVPLIAPARGRRPMYCSSTCRQTAQRNRAPQ